MKSKVCKRCGKSKSVNDFISGIYPEKGSGDLCCLCRRKNQGELTWKQKERIEEDQKRFFARRKAVRVKKYNKLHYRRIKQDAASWLEHMRNMGRIWDCGVRKNAKLWREHLKIVASIPGAAKAETFSRVQQESEALNQSEGLLL